MCVQSVVHKYTIAGMQLVPINFVLVFANGQLYFYMYLHNSVAEMTQEKFVIMSRYEKKASNL